MVLVDLLLHKKIRRNGWLPYTTLFYSSVRNFNTSSTFASNMVAIEIKVSNVKDKSINEVNVKKKLSSFDFR